MTKYLLGALGAAIALWVGLNLPDHYRKQGRESERAAIAFEVKAAKTKSDLELTRIKNMVKEERLQNAKIREERDKQFETYAADVRSGRKPGLYLHKSSVCPSREGETPRARGDEEDQKVRLDRDLEENLLRFAHSRDQVIEAFENFKAEVRQSQCFKTP